MAEKPVFDRRTRTRLLRGGASAGLVAAIVGTSLLALPVGADPIGDARAEAAVLARRIDDLALQEEILAEQYDGAVWHKSLIDAQLSAAVAQLSAAQTQAKQTQAALSGEAVAVYMHDGYVSTPTQSPFSGRADLAVEKGYFNVAANDQSTVLDQARTAQVALRAQQASLVVAQQQAAAAVADVAGRRTAVEQADTATRAALSQVQGQLVQLVAQQQAQIAAQQQAEELAILARQQQAAEQATTTTTAPPRATTASSSARLASSVATTGAMVAAAPSSTTTSTTAAPTTSTVARSTPPSADPTVPQTAPTPVKPAPTATRPTQPKPVLIGPPPAPPPTAPRAPAPSPRPPPKPPAPPPATSRGMIAVAFAQSQLGKPYAWGGAGPGSYDCSGLTMMAWLAAGVSLPHYTVAQYAAVAHVRIGSLQPGDLVFFGTDLHHVGIYVGGGMMIDAPHTGAFVRYDTIYEPDLQPFGGRPG